VVLVPASDPLIELNCDAPFKVLFAVDYIKRIES